MPNGGISLKDAISGYERQLIIKTSQDRLIDLQSRLLSLHPYEVPEFLVIPVAGGTEAYLTWLRESVGGKGIGE